jgi:hypothetical protein
MKCVLAVAALAILATAGCSGAQQSSAATPGATSQLPPPAVTASPTVTNLQNASLPLDRYVTSIDDYIELDYASKLLTYDCMKRFGYELNPGGRLKLTSLRDRQNRLGLVDEARAARLGYHDDPTEHASHDNGPKLTEKQAEVMFGRDNHGKPAADGVPKGGCTGEGYRDIGWNTDDDVWLQELENDAASRTFADKRGLTAVASWSACMKESGYRYDKPDDASQDPRWWNGGDAATASKAEKNTAVADVRCKKKVNYIGHLTAILIAYQQQIVEVNLERLESVHQQAQDALKKGATVLSER